MNEKKNFFYTLAIIVAIIFAWSVFFLFPNLRELQTMQEESLQSQTKKLNILKEAKDSEYLEKSIEDLNLQISKKEKKIIKYSSLDQIVNVMQREFNKYNIRIEHISPVLSSYLAVEKNTAASSFKQLPLEMKLEAKFMDFVHLLENSENLLFFLKPDQISISQHKNYPKTLLIDFKASVYVSRNKNL
jgi:hypothetical protein